MVELIAAPAGGPNDFSISSTSSQTHVYIVDDDSMVRRSLSFSLSTAGYLTRAFASGRDFLDEVDILPSGCVLLDIRMPEIDGLAVLNDSASESTASRSSP